MVVLHSGKIRHADGSCADCEDRAASGVSAPPEGRTRDHSDGVGPRCRYVVVLVGDCLRSGQYGDCGLRMPTGGIVDVDRDEVLDLIVSPGMSNAYVVKLEVAEEPGAKHGGINVQAVPCGDHVQLAVTCAL